MIRGVEKHDSSMTTSAMLGTFREKSKTRSEFLSHLNRARSRHSGGF
jgi:GTP cyclohydrolase I